MSISTSLLNVKVASSVSVKPRISLNKLAEYIEAGPSRRKKILYDAKYPANFIVTRYREAREIIKNYLTGVQDEDSVLKSINDFSEKKPETDFQEQDIKCSIEALESLLESDISMFSGCDIITYEDENRLIDVAGIDISVTPDLIVRKNISGINYVGAIKLHLSKSNTLTGEAQRIVAVMLNQYVGTYVSNGTDTVSPRLSWSFDLFNNSILGCPTAFKLRLKNIEAACEEIAVLWPSV